MTDIFYFPSFNKVYDYSNIEFISLESFEKEFLLKIKYSFLSLFTSLTPKNIIEIFNSVKSWPSMIINMPGDSMAQLKLEMN